MCFKGLSDLHFYANCSLMLLTCALRRIISAYCINHSLDKHSFERKIVNIFLHIRFRLYFGALKNRLFVTVLLSSHTICFGLEMRQ